MDVIERENAQDRKIEKVIIEDEREREKVRKWIRKMERVRKVDEREKVREWMKKTEKKVERKEKK